MTDMQLMNDATTTTDASPHEASDVQGIGCLGIVFGITFLLLVLFIAFGYPHYNTSRDWVFWIVGFGTLLIEAIVIYTAIFISRVVNT